jgi:hypothetical protein
LSRNSAPTIPYFEVQRLRKMDLSFEEIADRLCVAYGHRWWPKSLEEASLRGPMKNPVVERRILSNAIQSALYIYGKRKGFWKVVVLEMAKEINNRHFWCTNAARLAAIKYNMTPEGLPTCRKT